MALWWWWVWRYCNTTNGEGNKYNSMFFFCQYFLYSWQFQPFGCECGWTDLTDWQDKNDIASTLKYHNDCLASAAQKASIKGNQILSRMSALWWERKCFAPLEVKVILKLNTSAHLDEQKPSKELGLVVKLSSVLLSSLMKSNVSSVMVFTLV